MYIKQNLGKPHFEDMIWNKPETKALSGKLLIIGGNQHAISAPSTAFALALKNGAGEVRVAMPDKTKKLLGPAKPPEIEFTKSTPSGSFSKDALGDLLSYIAWADASLFAGDLSHNSETAILLEHIITKTSKLVVLTKDAVDYFVRSPEDLINRENTTLVLSFAQLQKILIAIKYPTALTFDIQQNRLTELLTDISNEYSCSFVTQHHDYIYATAGGKLSATKLPEAPTSWRLKTATSVAIWQMQNPQKSFDAITTAIAITL